MSYRSSSPNIYFQVNMYMWIQRDLTVEGLFNFILFLPCWQTPSKFQGLKIEISQTVLKYDTIFSNESNEILEKLSKQLTD